MKTEADLDDQDNVEFTNKHIKAKYKTNESNEKHLNVVKEHKKDRQDSYQPEASRIEYDTKDYLKRLATANAEMATLLKQTTIVENDISKVLNRDTKVSDAILTYDAKYQEILNKIDESKHIRNKIINKEPLSPRKNNLNDNYNEDLNLSDIKCENKLFDKKNDNLKDEITLNDILDNMKKLDNDIKNVGFAETGPARNNSHILSPARIANDQLEDYDKKYEEEKVPNINDSEPSGYTKDDMKKINDKFQADDHPKIADVKDLERNEKSDSKHNRSAKIEERPKLLRYSLHDNPSLVNTKDFLENEQRVYNLEMQEGIKDQETTFEKLKELIQSTKQDIELLNTKKEDMHLYDDNLTHEDNIRGNKVERITSLASTKKSAKGGGKYAYHTNWM